MAIDTRIIINIIKEVVKLIKITNINTYITCPDGINLIVVRVDTNQPGLYGLGCATYTQRCKAVVTVIEEYIKPLILGRNVMETQELWNLMNNNGYWRNGPVVNNAVSGVDMALWDIKGKIATVYKGNIIKNLIMDCQSYTKYRPNETTGGIFVSWRRKEELPTGA